MNLGLLDLDKSREKAQRIAFQHEDEKSKFTAVPH